MFALVKVMVDGTILAVPIEEIKVVVKKDGVKDFLPYEPAGDSDFSRGRKKKYCIFFYERDGSVRRWYIMIGCLGASLKKVLKKASKVVWLDHKDPKEPLPGDGSEGPTMEAVVPQLTYICAVVPSGSPDNLTNEATIMDMDEHATNGERAVNDKTSKIFVKVAAIKKVIKGLERQLQATNARVDDCMSEIPRVEASFGAFRETVDGQLQATNARVNECMSEIPRVEESFAAFRETVEGQFQATNARVNERMSGIPRVEASFGAFQEPDTTSPIFVKVAAIEKEIKDLGGLLQANNARVDQCMSDIPRVEASFAAFRETIFQELANLAAYLQAEGGKKYVLEWVNKIPADTNQSKAVTKGCSSDDSLENLSENTWEKGLFREEAVDTPTVSDENSETKSNSSQRNQDEEIQNREKVSDCS